MSRTKQQEATKERARSTRSISKNKNKEEDKPDQRSSQAKPEEGKIIYYV